MLQTLPALTAAVVDYLETSRGRMTQALAELVALESPTTDVAAAGRALDWLSDELATVGMRVRRRAGRDTAGLLVALPRTRTRRRPLQLLVGHCDTVWPVGTLARMPVAQRGDAMYGPGVFDMKAGLVQMLFALRAVRAVGLDLPATPVAVISSDEETGSRESQRTMVRLAQAAARAFVFEPAFGADGRLKTARKAVGEFTIVVRGRAAHAGLDPGAGASAVLELSHQIQQLFALNDHAAGVSVNVGTIDGGLRSNVVAPEVRATVDVRVPSSAEVLRLDAALRGLRPVTPGTSIEVSGGFHHPPLERVPRNRALWEQARTLGQALGLDLQEAAVGGASDGNTISQFTATLDGLGAVGDGAHADHEHVRLSGLVPRAALVALLLASPLAVSGPPTAEERGPHD
jgi:glutamate carboxypeptidase